MKTVDDLCKQFGSRWSPTKCGASSEIQIDWHSDYISAKKMGGNNEYFEIFERNKYLKKLPSMQRVKLLARSLENFPHSMSGQDGITLLII